MNLLPTKITNLRKLDETNVEYKGNKIYAFRWEWEEENDKGKEVTKKKLVCHLYREGSNNQPLNLGEMSDGSPFTAIAQSVNEAKWLIDYYIEAKLNRVLEEYGVTTESCWKYNHLRISERVTEKENLIAEFEKQGKVRIPYVPHKMITYVSASYKELVTEEDVLKWCYELPSTGKFYNYHSAKKLETIPQVLKASEYPDGVWIVIYSKKQRSE